LHEIQGIDKAGKAILMAKKKLDCRYYTGKRGFGSCKYPKRFECPVIYFTMYPEKCPCRKPKQTRLF